MFRVRKDMAVVAFATWIFSTALLLAEATHTFRPVPSNEGRQALERMIERMREEHGKVRFWQGTYQSIHESSRANKNQGDPSGETVQMDVFADFAIDYVGGRTFLRILDDPSKSAARRRHAIDQTYLREGNDYYVSMPTGYTRLGEQAERAAFKHTVTELSGRTQWPSLSDPSMFFSFDGQLTYWDRMARLLTKPARVVARLQDAPPGEVYCLVEKAIDAERDIWRVTIEGPKDIHPGEMISQRFVFDQEVNFYCTSASQMRGGSLTHEQHVAYEKTDGHLLPKRITRLFYHEDGTVKLVQILTVTTSRVGVEPAPDVFTLEVLGLRDGDEVIDNTLGGRRLTYSQGQLLPTVPTSRR